MVNNANSALVIAYYANCLRKPIAGGSKIPRACQIGNLYNVCMSRVFEAVYEKGDLHPVQPLDLPDKTRVRIAIIEDPESEELAAAAASGGAFDFLNDPAEDVYTMSDGKPV